MLDCTGGNLRGSGEIWYACTMHQLVKIRVRVTGNGDLIGPFFFQQNICGKVYLAMASHSSGANGMNSLGTCGGHRTVLLHTEEGSSHIAWENYSETKKLPWINRWRVAPKISWSDPSGLLLTGFLKPRVFTTPLANLDDLQSPGKDNSWSGHTQTRQGDDSSCCFRMRRALLCIERNGGHV